MRQVRAVLALLAVGLVTVVACSGGETLLGERDGAADGDADAPDDVGHPDDAAETADEVDETTDDGADAPDDVGHPDDAAETADEAGETTDDGADDGTEEIGPVCGNGTVESGEECDDGNTAPGDGCSATCTDECGNGVVDAGEECDRLDLDGQTCASRHRDAEGTLRCDATCRFDESGCRWCGSGTCELGETVESCPFDCHDGCGDGVCEDAEDQFGCPADCGAVAIAAGRDSSCALLADGTVMCWGNVPRAEGADPLEATSVIQDAEAISMSGRDGSASCGVPIGFAFVSHACALADGTVRCWGHHYGGTPVAVAEMNGVVALSAATLPSSCGSFFDYNCAVLLDGTVRCWWVMDASSTPVFSVPGVEAAVDVSAGGEYNCAILTDGSVECWARMVECDVSNPGIAGAVDISVRGGRACAVLRDGSLECWACDTYPEDFEHPPGLEEVVGVSLGQGFFDLAGHACVLLSNGTVWCWGDNLHGQLGDGTNLDAPSSAVPVSGSTGVVAVAAGSVHTCAIVEGGFAWCWGWNSDGQLGDGTTTDSNVPVQVAAW